MDVRRVAALAFILHLSLPGAGPAQQTQPKQAQSGQANEATSKPIDDAPATRMAPVQATIGQDPGPLTRDEVTLQVLNRFTYGPRPGDVERIRAEGISNWFSAQLNPQTIDDSDLDRRLADYPAMQLPLAKLVEQYPNNQMIRAAENGRVGVPRGEGEKAIYQAQMERYDQKKKGADAADARGSDPNPLPQPAEAYLTLDPDARFKAMTRLSPAQLQLLRQQTPADSREQLTAGFTPHQIEVLAAVNGPAAVVSSELIQTKLLRDLFSERQLNEVMTDFWLNHFNVYLKKSQVAPYYLVAYERDVIRPRALGNFEQLLVATAESPAMLNYLDNASSVGPHSSSVMPLVDFNYRQRLAPRPRQQASGLNENYARELMELHTLGVNGGYTQQDVTEVARVFTGWTIGRGRGDGGEPIHAEFDASKHEPGDKMVLGVKIKQDGLLEGMRVLHLLANSPQTARFISTKLAVRFVSDTPPPAMIDAMTAKFLETHGDIRRVLLAMINSPGFFTRETYRSKVKTPQDYVLSAVRASGADVRSAGALAATIADLGMPVYGMQTPNGYSMRADPWNNTAALISRMNFALALSTNRVAGVRTDLPALIAQSSTPATDSQSPQSPALQDLSPEQKDKLLEDRLLHAPASDRTRQTILSQITADPAQQRSSLNQITAKTPSRDPLSNVRNNRPTSIPVTDTETALAAGLLFGSPEFQRR